MVYGIVCVGIGVVLGALLVVGLFRVCRNATSEIVFEILIDDFASASFPVQRNVDFVESVWC